MTPEWRQWRRSGVSIINIVYFTPFSSVSIIGFDYVFVRCFDLLQTNVPINNGKLVLIGLSEMFHLELPLLTF